MAYLIDTDTIIYVLKGVETVKARFRENDAIPKSLSVITYGELLFGARHSQRKAENLSRVYRVKELFPVIDLDKAVIETFAELKAELVKKGQTLDDMDLLIAATALTHNLTLVTNNERHFSRISGLLTENWTR